MKLLSTLAGKKGRAEDSDLVKTAFTFLAGGIPVAVSVAGLVGLTTDGTLGRVMASHGDQFRWAVGLIIFAVVVGSVAFFVKNATLGAALGVLLLTGGVIWLVFLQVEVTKASDAPTVSLSVARGDTGMVASAIVTAGEIPSDRYISIKIVGTRAALKTAVPPLRPTIAASDSKWDYSIETLYDSNLGPSPRGDLDVKLEVPFTDQYTQVTVIAEYVGSLTTFPVVQASETLNKNSLPPSDLRPPAFDCGVLDGNRGCATTSLIQLYAPS